MIERYILKNGVPTPEPILTKWALWFEDHNEQRSVDKTKIGDAEISTVFLGLNHAFNFVLWMANFYVNLLYMNVIDSW